MRRGYSAYWGRERRYVSRPDWHTPTWLTTSEFATVLRTYDECAADRDGPDRADHAHEAATGPASARAFHRARLVDPAPNRPEVGYVAALGAMAAAEEAGHAARIILWFAN